MNPKRGVQALALWSFVAVLPARLDAQRSETGFVDRTVTVGGHAYPYQVYVPSAYGASNQRWPVILFLHGAGERGADGLFQTAVGLGNAVRRGASKYPAVIIFPQTPADSTWIGAPADAAMAALDQTLAELRTDSDRVYLTGLSLGGNGTWNLAYKYPDRFAAIAPICGFVHPFSRLPGSRAIVPGDTGAAVFTALARRIGRLPTWIIHGEIDPVVPVAESRRAAEALKAAGGDVRYTEILGGGHEIWDETYGSAQFREWLFAQRRGRSSSSSGAAAALSFMTTLDESGARMAALPFDSLVRTSWNFVPMERIGLPLARMSPSQRSASAALLRSGLSDDGYAKALGIIRHEAILAALEASQGRVQFRRDSTLYYAAVFGPPSPDSAWGWRFEGHHLSVNVTHVPGETQTVAPLFMGANPARVASGPNAGLRLLAEEEDVGRTLVSMLPESRRTLAVISDTAFPDIVTRNDPKVRPLRLSGLAAGSMSPAEQAQLRRLLEVYASRMTPEAARDQLRRIDQAGFEHLHFAWAGSLDRWRPHYYRIHGPTVLIEYDNTQNNANHIHTVWRDLERDFGGDVLRAHYTKHRHAP